jgi:hypothetical protein
VIGRTVKELETILVLEEERKLYLKLILIEPTLGL